MNSFNITFNPRPKIEITGDKNINYLIEIYEYRNGTKEFIQDFTLPTNNFICYLREWFGDYEIDIYEWIDNIGIYKSFTHRYKDEQKNVLIYLDTNQLNMALVWFNITLEYKSIHNCKLYIKSNFNDILKSIDNTNIIEFIDDINENNYYSIYNIGRYDTEYEWNRAFTGNIYSSVLTKNLTYCSYKNPRDWHNLSMDDVAYDILGMNKF